MVAATRLPRNQARLPVAREARPNTRALARALNHTEAVLFDWRGTDEGDPHAAGVDLPKNGLGIGIEGMADRRPPRARAAALDMAPAVAGRPIHSNARSTHQAGGGQWASSDFHLDLRRVLAQHGVADLFDAWVLSFEHGIQKPDPRMFTLALDALEIRPKEALMVGDRPSHDGGAATAGIPTLILPAPPDQLEPRGLEVVAQLLA